MTYNTKTLAEDCAYKGYGYTFYRRACYTRAIVPMTERDFNLIEERIKAEDEQG